MIRIENVEVFGWDAAIRGMRNPMNSWDKSDSRFQYVCTDTKPGEPRKFCDNCGYDLCSPFSNEPVYVIGPNDLELMKKLASAGDVHGKFMRMVNVTLDITAPLYWWKEFDTYKVGTVANSCSTMHKIHAKEFTFDDFSFEDCDQWTKDVVCSCIINALEMNRKKFLETKDKAVWRKMIQLLPSSYNQRRTVQLNYSVLRNMYEYRREHKLTEWREFCRWIETLPYAKLIVGESHE